ncbi:hypothetical protein SDRG_10501 [Saprolegnia diclina VS20]|uniref:RING-type domain-containing protein n=1 Tax=Saprolegnia diclina (strain VS20) TaxID=1156394 RepID=T0RHB3_SAPDV|nr:hypothetical protein SDRG_10501 [Saprolegnia diclina VS20]EQC31708.1 hypothetical protein SDRG_10501 [Saprolegnia diclina VS20]|eukprot:XP_008614715.1 hypothetical protein SDRG_10501 [Saprolegnia diclina VS20]
MSFVPTRPLGRRDSRGETPERDDGAFTSVVPSAKLRSTAEALLQPFSKRPEEVAFPRKQQDEAGNLPKTKFLAMRRQNAKGRSDMPRDVVLGVHRNLAALTSINTKERNDAIQARQELEKAKVDIEALKGELRTIHAQENQRAASRESNRDRVRTSIATPSTPRMSHLKSFDASIELDAKLRALENQHQSLVETNRQLIKQLQKAEAGRQHASLTLDSTRSDLERAANEVLALRAQAQELREHSQTLTQFEAISKKLAQENDQLRLEVVRAHDDVNAKALRDRKGRQGLHDEIAALASEKAVHIERIAELTATVAAISDAHAATHAKLLHLESVHAILEAQVETLMETNLELARAKAGLSDELAHERSSDSRQERNALNAKCLELANAVGKLETDLLLERNVSAKKQALVDQYKASMAGMTAQIEALVKQVAHLEAHQAPRDESSLLHRLHDAPASANATVAALQMARNGKDEALSILSEEKAQLATRVRELQQENAALVLRLKSGENNQIAVLQAQMQALLTKQTDSLRAKDAAVADLAKARADYTALRVAFDDLQARTTDPAAATLLRRAHDELRATVQKIVEAEASSESTFTCLLCMQVLEQPMTLVGCGHTFCRRCVVRGNRESKIVCKECHYECMEKSLFENQALADLAARFVFRQQALASLTATCRDLGAAFAASSPPT